MSKDYSKILLITDMDGTLLPSSKVLSKTDLEAINTFTRRGGNFSIATGRPIQSVKFYFDELKINFPIILYNGGMIYDTQKSEVLWKNYLPTEARGIVETVLNRFPEVSAEMITYERIYSLQKNEYEQYHIDITKTNVIECPIEEIPDDWFKILFALNPEKMPELKAFIEKFDFNFVEFVQTCRHFYEVLPKNISKGEALKVLKELYELNDYTIVAVGDFDNDIEMLKIADIGIATANAIDRVKEIADIVLEESCNENAIAKVIDYIFSNEDLKSKIIIGG